MKRTTDAEISPHTFRWQAKGKGQCWIGQGAEWDGTRKGKEVSEKMGWRWQCRHTPQVGDAKAKFDHDVRV